MTKPDVLRSRQLSAQSNAWQAFVKENGPGWVASWNEATETPKAIFGVGLRLQQGQVSASEIKALSWEVLNRYRELLGTGESTYQLAIDAVVNGVHVFVYDQLYRGLPVIGGRADVRINDRGILSMLGSQTFPIPEGFDTIPRIGSAQARMQAYLGLGIQPGDSTSGLTPMAVGRERLVIWGDVHARVKSPVSLAWEVVVEEPGQGVAGRAYIDASAGALLRWESDIHNSAGTRGFRGGTSSARAPRRARPDNAGPGTFSGNVMAWVNVGLRPGDPAENVPLPNLAINIPGEGTVFTDSFGDFSVSTSQVTPVDVTVTLSGLHVGDVVPFQGLRVEQTLSLTPGVPAQFQLLTAGAVEFDQSQTNAYWHANEVSEYLRRVLSPANAGLLSGLDSVEANVNLDQSCNAFYLNNTMNFFASSAVCNNTAYSTIIHHEWGHGLDDQFGGISQTDGLSEGWGDVVAMYHTGQHIVGDAFQLNGAILRSGFNTRQYPADECGGAEHCEGETWMGFAWKARENLRASLGDAAGTALAEQIVLGSIVADAANQVDAVLEVFLLDDDDGNLLNGTPNYTSLLSAAAQHGLPHPAREVVTLEHNALDDTELHYAPRVVRVTATPMFGALRELRLVVASDATGGAPLTRTMVPAVKPNEYVALLPGYISPDIVRYHIESEHEDGDIVRLPETGNFTYQVGVGETFLVDDFEAGSVGWTHGLVANQDDWQLGAAGGVSGQAGGTPWSDPPTPFSGANIWGNDLGEIGFNGRYATNVENWLRAPTLNTLGKTGVSLSFARWLTVEDGAFDQATIHVNGQEVWANPVGTNLVDTDWSIQTIPIPMADNQPSVDIEWRLKTDGSVQFGGWNIDDVRVSTLVGLAAPDILYRLQPEQTPVGGPMALTAFGSPGASALILLSLTPGPIVIPDLFTLNVGHDAIAIPGSFNNLGIIFANFNAPSRPEWVGKLLYSQVVALVNGTDLVVSNPTVVLFTQ